MPPMDPDVPILEFDPEGHAIIEPHMVRERLDVPVAAVPCFFADVIASVCDDGGAKVLTRLLSAHGAHPVYAVEWNGFPIAVYQPGVGSPLAAMFLEEVIETGCRIFVAVGGAGGLVPDLTVGHVVVPTSAIRDEGTSYHYLPASREVWPSPRAVAAIENVLQSHHVPFVTGKVWTTDAPYRETRGKVEHRVEEGCLAVDMEARRSSPSRSSGVWSSVRSSLRPMTYRRNNGTIAASFRTGPCANACFGSLPRQPHHWRGREVPVYRDRARAHDVVTSARPPS